MVTREESGHTVWVDLESPTAEEVQAVAEEFRLGERITSEILEPTPVPIVVPEHEAVLLVLHFPTPSDDTASEPREIDIVIGRHFLLTAHYEPIPAFRELSKLIETERILGSSSFKTDELLELVMTKLFGALRAEINHDARALDKIERDMFAGQERVTIRAISDASRGFLHLESALASQEEPLASFLRVLERRQFFGPAFTDRVERLSSERDQVARLLASHRAVAIELRETNAALINASQNQIMKTLTVVNFIFLPLGLISAVFTMNTRGTPLVDRPDSFWIVVGILIAVAGILTLYFARKRWL